MRTRRLYLEAPLQLEFAADVEVCRPLPDGSWEVILNQTAFYPTGGGQPHDTGWLWPAPGPESLGDGAAARPPTTGPAAAAAPAPATTAAPGAGAARVSGVVEQAGRIVHTVDRPLMGRVKGRVEAARRLDHTEQHTAQHLLSACFEHLYQLPTLSWHLGDGHCTIDLPAPDLTPEQLLAVETEAFALIRAGLEVKTYEVTQAEANDLPLRKPPSVEGLIRIVEIDGYDWSACGGTHVQRLSELGLIKIKGVERYKGGVRITFLAGQRAFADYGQLHEITQGLARSLTTSVADLPDAFRRLDHELTEARRELRDFREQALASEAATLVARARTIGGARVVKVSFGGRSLEELKQLAAKIAAQGKAVAIVGREGALPQLVITRSPDVRLDAGAILKQVLPVIEGKGGGSPLSAQGGGTRPDQLATALDMAVARVADALLVG